MGNRHYEVHIRVESVSRGRKARAESAKRVESVSGVVVEGTCKNERCVHKRSAGSDIGEHERSARGKRGEARAWSASVTLNNPSIKIQGHSSRGLTKRQTVAPRHLRTWLNASLTGQHTPAAAAAASRDRHKGLNPQTKVLRHRQDNNYCQ